MPKKISIVTGPIVGLQSTRFIEETISFSGSVGEKVVFFNLFDEILEQSGTVIFIGIDRVKRNGLVACLGRVAE